MLLDTKLRVMTAQSITASGQVSASSIDLQDLGREIGTGEPLQFHVTFGAVNFAGTSTSVVFEAIVATNAALTTGIAVVGATIALAADLAILTAGNAPGFRVVVPIGEQPIVDSSAPKKDFSATDWNVAHRYLGLRISGVAAGTITALNIAAADLVRAGSDSTLKNYRSGIVVA